MLRKTLQIGIRLGTTKFRRSRAFDMRGDGVVACSHRQQPEVGLCVTCVFARPIDSAKRSRFWLCGLHDENPSYPKYPRLPVLHCHGYQPGTGVAKRD
jgi:hypothetical protein